MHTPGGERWLLTNAHSVSYATQVCGLAPPALLSSSSLVLSFPLDPMPTRSATPPRCVGSPPPALLSSSSLVLSFPLVPTRTRSATPPRCVGSPTPPRVGSPPPPARPPRPTRNTLAPCFPPLPPPAPPPHTHPSVVVNIHTHTCATGAAEEAGGRRKGESRVRPVCVCFSCVSGGGREGGGGRGGRRGRESDGGWGGTVGGAGQPRRASSPTPSPLPWQYMARVLAIGTECDVALLSGEEGGRGYACVCAGGEGVVCGGCLPSTG